VTAMLRGGIVILDEGNRMSEKSWASLAPLLDNKAIQRRLERLWQGLTQEEKLALFSLWSDRGDLDELALAVKQHPAWLEYAWLGMAKYYAQKKDFRSAYELTQRYGEPVALPRVDTNSSMQELEKRFSAMPNNYGVGYALYRAQRQSGRVDDALSTARHFSERPNSPAYFHFLEAQCWAEKQNWERAWNAWQAFRSAQITPAR